MLAVQLLMLGGRLLLVALALQAIVARAASEEAWDPRTPREFPAELGTFASILPHITSAHHSAKQFHRILASNASNPLGTH